jgi:hypothetical protein
MLLAHFRKWGSNVSSRSHVSRETGPATARSA